MSCWPQTNAIFQVYHCIATALWYHNFMYIFHPIPYVPQHHVGDVTWLTLSFQVSIPVLPWLWWWQFRTKHCAECFRLFHLLDIICFCEYQCSLITQLPTHLGRREHLGIFSSLVLPNLNNFLSPSDLTTPTSFLGHKKAMQIHSSCYTIHWHINVNKGLKYTCIYIYQS